MLILASASPRRRKLLALLTQDFVVVPAVTQERVYRYQAPAGYALITASAKAYQVSLGHPGPVLGADTVVCKGARIIGKPADKADNTAMLLELSDSWHSVITAVAMYQQGEVVDRALVSTRVLFSPISVQEAEEYSQSGEGLDKAGGYGIQGVAGKFVAALDGCYYNVVGLPLTVTARLLAKNL